VGAEAGLTFQQEEAAHKLEDGPERDQEQATAKASGHPPLFPSEVRIPRCDDHRPRKGRAPEPSDDGTD
jgi:hypothetical protein